MIDPRIAEGVKLVPEYEKRLRHREKHPEMDVCVSQAEMKTICAALTAAGEMGRELGEAREALKPFAEEAKGWSLGTDEEYRPDFYNEAFSVGDLRRAARALETTKPRI